MSKKDFYNLLFKYYNLFIYPIFSTPIINFKKISPTSQLFNQDAGDIFVYPAVSFSYINPLIFRYSLISFTLSSMPTRALFMVIS